jgi:7-carboxy-7-deazaguanine synthase
MKVAETFKSIQGESTFAGRPCFFIRLAGCNLDCRGCDTRYARFADAAAFDADIDELVEAAEHSGVRLVEITGGEPLLQSETPDLCEALLKAGFTVLLETNGSLPIARIPRKVHRIMDCKCPSSGESESTLSANFAELTPDDEVKFVIADRADFDHALAIAARFDLPGVGCALLFSPASAVDDFLPAATPALLSEWMLDESLDARLQPQLHKIIWPGENRGR